VRIQADDTSRSTALMQALDAQRPRTGTIVSFADVALAELTARVFDFVWIDLEHSLLSPRDVAGLIAAVQGAGTHALVRVPSSGSELLQAVVDFGADGIVAPRVESAAQAAALVRRLHLPPGGARGYAPRRVNGFGQRTGEHALGERPACVVQVETAAGVEACHEIAAVDGVDVVVVGCADLSVELGVALDLAAPALTDALRTVGEAVAAAGVALGLAAGDGAAQLAERAGVRPRMLLYSSDARIYATAAAAAAEAATRAADQLETQREPTRE